MNKQDKTELLAYFNSKNQTHRIAVCAITGISATIDAPALPFMRGQAYSYQHPLASFANCQAVASLSFSELSALSSSLLAALTLSYLSHFHLRIDKLTALEANMTLSQLPAVKIIAALRFLVTLSDYKAKRIPRLSLEETNANCLTNWLLDARKSLDEPLSEKSKWTIPVIAKTKEIIDSSADAADRTAAKQLVAALIEADIITPKLSTLFKQSYFKNNLVWMDETMRQSLCKYLSRFPDSADAVALVNLYQRTKSSSTAQEKIIATQLESDWSNASQSFKGPQALSTPKTLKEIIAARKEQLAREAARKQHQFAEAKVSLANEIFEIAQEVDHELQYEDELISDALAMEPNEVDELDLDEQHKIEESDEDADSYNSYVATDDFISKLEADNGGL